MLLGQMLTVIFAKDAIARTVLFQLGFALEQIGPTLGHQVLEPGFERILGPIKLFIY